MNHDRLRELLHEGIERQCSSLPLDPNRVENVLHAVKDEACRNRLHSRHHLHSAPFGWRLCAVVVAAVCLVFAGASLPAGWLHLSQTKDEEQLLQSGQNAPDAFHASAGSENMYGTFVPETWDEVLSCFPSQPPSPQWLPEGWQVDMYNVCLTEFSSDLTILYTNASPDARLIYQVAKHTDYSGIHQYIEQDGCGYIHPMPDGSMIYITSNVGRRTASWNVGTSLYFISGDISQEELIRMAESVR